MCKYAELYFNYMRSNGKSEKSIESYKYDIKSLEDFLKTKDMSIDNNIKDLDFSIMSEFKSYLFNKKLSPNTMNRRFRMLRKFFGYMINMKIVNDNCCENIEDSKIPGRVMIIPTKEEMNSVSENLDKKIENGKGRCNEYLAVRNKIIIKILSALGLRSAELRELKLTNIKQNGMISVIGKGNKERRLWINEELMKEYKEYLIVRKEHLDKYNKECEYIFFSYRCKQIGKSDLNEIIKDVGKGSGVESLDHAHVLRHYCASDIVRTTGNIQLAKEILGHEKISTTQIYTHTEEDDIKHYLTKGNAAK